MKTKVTIKRPKVTREELQELHRLVTERLRSSLLDSTKPVRAAMMKEARMFLADNDISVNKTEVYEALHEVSVLPFKSNS